MTFVTYQERPSDTSFTAVSAGSLAHSLFAVGGKLRAAWDRKQTERAIEAMPASLRKDLGWPTSDIMINAAAKS